MTPDEIAVKFINDHNMPFQTDGSKYRALVAMITETQAAAVQAERNELEAAVHRTIMANTLVTYNERCTIDDEVHAAIRARSNGEGRK